MTPAAGRFGQEIKTAMQPMNGCSANVAYWALSGPKTMSSSLPLLVQ
jgi:hypothetical protein